MACLCKVHLQERHGDTEQTLGKVDFGHTKDPAWQPTLALLKYKTGKFFMVLPLLPALLPESHALQKSLAKIRLLGLDAPLLLLQMLLAGVKIKGWLRGLLFWAMSLSRMCRHRWMKTPQSPEPLCCHHYTDQSVLTSPKYGFLHQIPNGDAQLLLSHLSVAVFPKSPQRYKEEGPCVYSSSYRCSHLTLGRDLGVSPSTWLFVTFLRTDSELKPAARKAS